MNRRSKSTKYQWVEESVMKNHGAKMRLSKSNFKSVLSIQRWTRGGGQKKMHSSAIYKGYALYKIDVKNTLQQQNSMWCQFATNVFSEFLLLLFRDMLLIFLLYGFSKHVHISVLSSCLFVGLCCFFCIFFPQYVVFFFKACLSFYAFQLYWSRWKAITKMVKRATAKRAWLKLTMWQEHGMEISDGGNPSLVLVIQKRLLTNETNAAQHILTKIHTIRLKNLQGRFKVITRSQVDSVRATSHLSIQYFKKTWCEWSDITP